MYSKTKGIVLNSIKYGESSIICRIYTAKLGLQSYLVNGVRKKEGGVHTIKRLIFWTLQFYIKTTGNYSG